MAERPREFRPYRVAMYTIFVAFVLLFVGLLIRSIWIDLYARDPVRGVAEPSITACADEIESLFAQITSRSVPEELMSPRHDRWDEFARRFEDRIQLLQDRCGDIDARTDADEEAREVILETTSRLESLRMHLARCGRDGEEQLVAVAESLQTLRELRRRR